MKEAERQRQSYALGFNQALAKYRVAALRQVAQGRSLLDVGCGPGDVTLGVADLFQSVVGLDITAEYLGQARSRNRFAHVRFVHAEFEQFATSDHFDCVLAVDVLEHVPDPGAFLHRAAGLLSAGGQLCCIVPNAESLHRRIGLEMGMIPSLTALEAQDYAVGHRRYYTLATLRRDLDEAGFVVSDVRGILLKPFPNSRMSELPEEYCDALFEVGKELPELCGEILAVAHPRAA